jgi:uncharacterized protein (DUF952 family)
MDKRAYKIEDAAIWADAMGRGVYEGSPLDRADGFIHLSAGAQVRETAQKWFAGRTNLILATIDLEALADTVRWEASRGGALFPHVYGPLPASAVIKTIDLLQSDTGEFLIPDLGSAG